MQGSAAYLFACVVVLCAFAAEVVYPLSGPTLHSCSMETDCFTCGSLEGRRGNGCLPTAGQGLSESSEVCQAELAQTWKVMPCIATSAACKVGSLYATQHRDATQCCNPFSAKFGQMSYIRYWYTRILFINQCPSLVKNWIDVGRRTNVMGRQQI